MTLPGRTYIARHGETVFNAARRMQGDQLDTPLTRTGFAQADAMGETLARRLGLQPPLELWSSPSGRALQTLAIIAEHIGADWHGATRDRRLQEIDVGEWAGRNYADIMADQGDILDPHEALFSVRPPGGEWYDDIAARLQKWIDDTAHLTADRLVIMHGMSSRVLRGMLLGLPIDPLWRAPIAPSLPQGTMVMIDNGVEEIVHLGGSAKPA
ncbi:histidine phosphatase family protein [Aquisediminimonas profunda]|uniref:histidine phosphatase family protein n=1 Tax=Aquisediminimonas profunda TaxID=1550733 RepID=UPI001C625455|nr:histidine phosphatase family protein [Aquisediminimonas profunda]